MRSESVLVAEMITTESKPVKKKQKTARASRAAPNPKELEKLKKISGLKDELIASCLDISVKTYRSYREGITRMKNTTKERVQLLTDLFAHGVNVFGSSEKFNEWLNTENFVFGKKAPVESLRDVKGIGYIDSRLTAMEYGDNV